MNLTDIRMNDIIEHADHHGELWLVVYASPDKVVVQRTKEITDAIGWRKADAYKLTGNTG